MVTLAILKSRLVQLGLVGLIGIGIGAFTHKKMNPPTITVVHDVKQVYVDVPKLIDKVVDKIITDPAQQQAMAAILKENRELKLKVTELYSTVATIQTSGGTQETSEPLRGTVTEVQQPASEPVEPPTYRYEDWQLKATYGQTKFSYNLTQKFIIESTLGSESSQNGVGITRLFQESPNGLLPIPAETTVIHAAPVGSRFIVSPRFQLGLGINQDKTKLGLVAFQWLKHGSSRDPKDIRWAFLSPMVYGTGTQTGYGILPISLNLGSFKYDPISNLWVSVLVDKDKKVGLTLTLTF